jgi:hypothetical protein
LACLADSTAASFSISSSDFLIKSTSSSGSTCAVHQGLVNTLCHCASPLPSGLTCLMQMVTRASVDTFRDMPGT